MCLFDQGEPQRVRVPCPEQARGWRQVTVRVLSLLVCLVQHIAVSSGSGKNDLEKMSSILEAVPQVKFICLDVANGYSEHFVEFLKLVRARFPEHTIMVGMVGRPPLDGEAEKMCVGCPGSCVLFGAFGAFFLAD